MVWSQHWRLHCYSSSSRVCKGQRRERGEEAEERGDGQGETRGEEEIEGDFAEEMKGSFARDSEGRGETDEMQGKNTKIPKFYVWARFLREERKWRKGALQE